MHWFNNITKVILFMGLDLLGNYGKLYGFITYVIIFSSDVGHQSRWNSQCSFQWKNALPYVEGIFIQNTEWYMYIYVSNIRTLVAHMTGWCRLRILFTPLQDTSEYISVFWKSLKCLCLFWAYKYITFDGNTSIQWINIWSSNGIVTQNIPRKCLTIILNIFVIV